MFLTKNLRTQSNTIARTAFPARCAVIPGVMPAAKDAEETVRKIRSANNGGILAIFGAQFFRFQTRLDTASDDLDNASRANLEALKSEANRILVSQEADVEAVCSLLSAFA